jgi:hypothetical protein
MEEQVHVASNTHLFILSLAHLPEMFLKSCGKIVKYGKKPGSDTRLKRHAPVGAPLRMKKDILEGATAWREDDQQYTYASVFLKLYSGVWTNHSVLPHLLQQL